MKEYKSIKEMLLSTEQRLIEAQKSIIERQKEIKIDLEDCRKALKALGHVPEAKEKVDRVPKIGDVLVCIKQDHGIADVGDEVLIVSTDDVSVTIQRKDGTYAMYINTSLSRYFRFADEEPTDEDKANLHSFQHVNQEPKKPYRIKTREEMIAGGGFVDEIERIWSSADKLGMPFSKPMHHLQGKGLYTDKYQSIDIWAIHPWMITENT